MVAAGSYLIHLGDWLESSSATTFLHLHTSTWDVSIDWLKILKDIEGSSSTWKKHLSRKGRKGGKHSEEKVKETVPFVQLRRKPGESPGLSSYSKYRPLVSASFQEYLFYIEWVWKRGVLLHCSHQQLLLHPTDKLTAV